MKIDRVIPEPFLEFGNGGKSFDIREGIINFGPVDVGTVRALREVKIGIVGTGKTIAAFSEWMAAAQSGLEGVNPLNPQFNPKFPGLGSDVGFRASFATDPSWVSEIPERELGKICKEAGATSKLATLFREKIESLYQLSSAPPDVVICLPSEIVMKTVRPRFMQKEKNGKNEDADRIDFHDYLKGLCLRSKSVFQLIWPRTYSDKAKGTQDTATRAWNLFSGLFYKAGGTPWKLLKSPFGKTTCYVGISFSRRDDGQFLHSSLTQVFNDKGEGTILRGGLANRSEDDREVHLSESSAKELLATAIQNFAKANDGRQPDRVVVHKSSGYDQSELDGFDAASEEVGVSFTDYLALGPSDMRFFRYGDYPPLRGTHIILDDDLSILYTRGSVPFYRKYPGPYVPRTLQIRYYQCERSQTELAEEILALTKLNWNKTQFDSFFPITLEGSKQIGTIYKWCDNPPEDAIPYSFFM